MLCVLFFLWLLSDYINGEIIDRIDLWGKSQISTYKQKVFFSTLCILLSGTVLRRIFPKNSGPERKKAPHPEKTLHKTLPDNPNPENKKSPFLRTALQKILSKKSYRESKTSYFAASIFFAVYLFIRIGLGRNFVMLTAKIAWADLLVLPCLLFGVKFMLEFIESLANTKDTTYSSLVDEPLTSSESDALNVSKITQDFINIFNTTYNKAFTIGMNAEWGKGKSTFIAFIKERISNEKDLRDTCIILDFNPYDVLSEKPLELRFFEELSATVSRYDKNVSIKINQYINSIIKEEKWYLGLMNLIFPNRINIEGINKALKSSRKKLIIIIDDIDRLVDLKDIINVFQLIRNCNNLENTYIIASYDKKNVNTIFNSHKIDLTYIDKIINYEYKLPSIDEKVYFRQYIGKLLFDLAKDLYLPQNAPEEDLESLREEINRFIEWEIMPDNIKPTILDGGYNSIVAKIKSDPLLEKHLTFSTFFRNTREIKKFFISLNIKLQSIKNEVNFIDYFLFHLIKFHEHQHATLINIIKSTKFNHNDIPYEIFIYPPLHNQMSYVTNNKKEIKIKTKDLKVDTPLNNRILSILQILCFNRVDKHSIAFRNSSHNYYYVFENYYEFELSRSEIYKILANIEDVKKHNPNKVLYLYNWIVNHHEEIKQGNSTFNSLKFLYTYCRENKKTKIESEPVMHLYGWLKEEEKLKFIDHVDLEDIPLSISVLSHLMKRNRHDSIFDTGNTIQDTLKEKMDRLVSNFDIFSQNIYSINHSTYLPIGGWDWYEKIILEHPNLTESLLHKERNPMFREGNLKFKNQKVVLDGEKKKIIEKAIKQENDYLYNLIQWNQSDDGYLAINSKISFTCSDFLDSIYNGGSYIWERYHEGNTKLESTHLFSHWSEIFTQNNSFITSDYLSLKSEITLSQGLKFTIPLPINNLLIKKAHLECSGNSLLSLKINEKAILANYNIQKEIKSIDIKKHLKENDNLFEMVVQKPTEDWLHENPSILFKVFIEFDLEVLGIDSE